MELVSHLISLLFILRDLLVELSTLLYHASVSHSLLSLYLLNVPVPRVDPHLSLLQCPQNVRRHRVYVQLGLAGHTNRAKVLLLVVRVQLWKRKRFVDALNAAESGTEIALSDLFALELSLGLSANTAVFLSHERRLKFDALRSERVPVYVRQGENVLLCGEGVSQLVGTDSDHGLSTVESVGFVHCCGHSFQLLFKLRLEGSLILHQLHNTLIDIYG